jgi:hypothetical protein
MDTSVLLCPINGTMITSLIVQGNRNFGQWPIVTMLQRHNFWLRGTIVALTSNLVNLLCNMHKDSGNETNLLTRDAQTRNNVETKTNTSYRTFVVSQLQKNLLIETAPADYQVKLIKRALEPRTIAVRGFFLCPFTGISDIFRQKKKHRMVPGALSGLIRLYRRVPRL